MVVGPTVINLYQEAIDYNPKQVFNPDWHYRIVNFPVVHGMSGGPVFLIRGDRPYVVANLTGAAYDSLGTHCALVVGNEKLETFS